MLLMSISERSALISCAGYCSIVGKFILHLFNRCCSLSVFLCEQPWEAFGFVADALANALADVLARCSGRRFGRCSNRYSDKGSGGSPNVCCVTHWWFSFREIDGCQLAQ
jgi:hypothetical protein